MRNNLPVTGRECLIPEGQTLVSVTDTKGRITYCNAAFVSVSGYSADELLGQPHNLVRHPDMPAEAFRDLWATIASGRPWTGLVKNRSKNGDHYWVRANAAPVMDGDRISGYLSVRGRPDRASVDAADALYAVMRAEAASGRLVHVLRHGRVHRTDLAGRVREALRLHARARLVLMQAATVGAAAVATQVAAPLAGWAWAAAWVPTLAGLVMASTWAVGRLTTAPLLTILDDARRLAAGDLAHAVSSGADGLPGELQQALAQLAVNLRTLVADTRREVAGVSGSVAEIKAGNLDLSARTEAQAGSLQQTTSAMAQITGTVRQSAQSALTGSQLAEQTAEVAARSDAAVQALALSMQAIRASSQRVGEIIHVIEGVAFQTNMLALNAAVEAARAGSSGRGFAVVAAEVRALAQRSAVSARQIRTLIDESSACVETGTVQSAEARDRMHEALGAVRRVSALLGEISTGARHQEDDIEQVNRAIQQIDGFTQQNAAMVEQLAASAQALGGQVDGVNHSMRLFRLDAGERTLADADAVALRRAARTEPG